MLVCRGGVEIGPLQELQKGPGAALSPQIPAPYTAIKSPNCSFVAQLNYFKGIFRTCCPGAIQRGAGGDAITDRPPKNLCETPPNSLHADTPLPNHPGILSGPPRFKFLGVTPRTRSSPPFWAGGVDEAGGECRGWDRHGHHAAAGAPGRCHCHGNLLAAE